MGIKIVKKGLSSAVIDMEQGADPVPPPIKALKKPKSVVVIGAEPLEPETKKPAPAPKPAAKAVKPTVQTPETELKQSIAKVDITHKTGAVESHEEVVKEFLVPSPSAKVSVSFGFTRNTGNWENLKAMVTLTMPCAATAEDIEATYAEVRDWVDAKVGEISESIPDSSST